jgi:hypothetical protein
MTSKLEMMDLKVLHAAATLTLPVVSFQYLVAELPIVFPS